MSIQNKAEYIVEAFSGDVFTQISIFKKPKKC